MSAKTKRRRTLCPVTYALEIFGDRWTLLILRDVMLEARYRYKELLAANKGIATNVLADRLKRLERRGFIEKKRDPSDARQFLYQPTELGIGVIPMLVEMMVWGARQGNISVPASFLERYETDRTELIEDLRRKIHADPRRTPPASSPGADPKGES